MLAWWNFKRQDKLWLDYHNYVICYLYAKSFKKGEKMTNQELFLVFGAIVTCYAGYLFFKAYYTSKKA